MEEACRYRTGGICSKRKRFQNLLQPLQTAKKLAGRFQKLRTVPAGMTSGVHCGGGGENPCNEPKFGTSGKSLLKAVEGNHQGNTEANRSHATPHTGY